MEEQHNPGKKILKPSVIHDDLPEAKKPEHLRKTPVTNDDALPENPERHYHHDELADGNYAQEKIEHADDDSWNGEDA